MRFSLTGGSAGMKTYLAAYKRSGTVYSIVSLLAEKAASPSWHLYRKQPKDGRVRYTTGDLGSDMRTEVVQHPALKLLNKPNDFFTRFEFFEGSNQHMELTGETYWVLNNENFLRMPTAMWYVTPDRMEPVPDAEDYLLGWIYTAPDGTQVPLDVDQVIQEKRPDPEDPYRGFGPVGSILPNIEQQRYATEYQRNLFVNGAEAGGVIEAPNSMDDNEWEQLVDRWREQHQGVARAGAVGVLENGAKWVPNSNTNKDMEYGNLRLANRDEIREAWRIHKAMLGTSDDVNRANAETADEIFNGTLIVPRLDRRKETLNNKLLRLYKDDTVEFDYENPVEPDREQENVELTAKTTAWATLVNAGADPHMAADVVGLPDMDMVAPPVPLAPAVPVVAPSTPQAMPTEEQNALAALLQRPFTARALPAAAQNGRR